jgi:hypothetical protein
LPYQLTKAACGLLLFIVELKVMKRFFVLIALFFLVACSKITAENYQKISAGMSRTEVVALLGEPSSTERGSFLGVEGESAVWQNGTLQIRAQFVNQKLLTHTLLK